MRKKLNAKGFTLIELLIVIIIIGILAAIAFVAYNGSQTKAKQSAAQSAAAQSRSKLGEYNADNGYYPKDLATFTTWLNDTGSNGGASPSLASTLAADSFAYAAKASDGSACDNSATPCAQYTLSATASSFGGSTNISVTN